MDKYFIVLPKDAYENRDRIMDFLDDVRDSVSQELNFHYEFICGSVKCKMVAFTRRNNDGMNFDVDIVPDTKAAEKDYYSDEIKKIIYDAVSLHCRRNVGCMMPYMDYTPRTLEEIRTGRMSDTD